MAITNVPATRSNVGTALDPKSDLTTMVNALRESATLLERLRRGHSEDIETQWRALAAQIAGLKGDDKAAFDKIVEDLGKLTALEKQNSDRRDAMDKIQEHFRDLIKRLVKEHGKEMLPVITETIARTKDTIKREERLLEELEEFETLATPKQSLEEALQRTLDGKFDEGFDTLAANLTRRLESITVIEGRFNTIEGSMWTIGRRFDTIEGAVSTIGQQVGQILTTIASFSRSAGAQAGAQTGTRTGTQAVGQTATRAGAQTPTSSGDASTSAAEEGIEISVLGDRPQAGQSVPTFVEPGVGTTAVRQAQDARHKRDGSKRNPKVKRGTRRTRGSQRAEKRR